MGFKFDTKNIGLIAALFLAGIWESWNIVLGVILFLIFKSCFGGSK